MRSIDIVDTLLEEGSFKNLLAALQAAKLVDFLQGAGPFTVFAPTDQAFARLPAGSAEELMKPENGAGLTALLKHHIAKDRFPASSLDSLGQIEACDGGTIHIAADGSGIRIEGANIHVSDIQCTNGIIHGIDAVLKPA